MIFAMIVGGGGGSGQRALTLLRKLLTMGPECVLGYAITLLPYLRTFYHLWDGASAEKSATAAAIKGLPGSYNV